MMMTDNLARKEIRAHSMFVIPIAHFARTIHLFNGRHSTVQWIDQTNRHTKNILMHKASKISMRRRTFRAKSRQVGCIRQIWMIWTFSGRNAKVVYLTMFAIRSWALHKAMIIDIVIRKASSRSFIQFKLVVFFVLPS